MAEIKKLPLEDVRRFAQQLIHSYGGLAELAEKHPWIREYSQEVVREVYGDEFNAWRYLTLKKGQKIKPEAIVSLTGNPAWLVYAMATAPGAYWGIDPISKGSTMMIVEHAILKYRLTYDRVIFYVPAIMDLAIDMYGDSLKKWIAKKDREYPMSIWKVFRSIAEANEEEIVADVTGLEPEVIDFSDKEDNWWWDKDLVHDIAQDRVSSVSDYLDEMLKRGKVVISKKWPRERMQSYLESVYERIQDYFRA